MYKATQYADITSIHFDSTKPRALSVTISEGSISLITFLQSKGVDVEITNRAMTYVVPQCVVESSVLSMYERAITYMESAQEKIKRELTLEMAIEIFIETGVNLDDYFKDYSKEIVKGKTNLEKCLIIMHGNDDINIDKDGFANDLAPFISKCTKEAEEAVSYLTTLGSSYNAKITITIEQFEELKQYKDFNGELHELFNKLDKELEVIRKAGAENE